MVVIFYQTTTGGGAEVARVNLVDGRLEGPKTYVDLLLSAGQQPAEAMKQAPSRFNGSYLRAKFQA